MASIDERVVSMAFDNAKFEAGVAQTLASLAKLDASLKTIGANTNFAAIDAAANKVTLEGPSSALDRLKAKFTFGRESASFSEIDAGANKVTLQGPSSALDRLKAKFSFSKESASFSEIDAAANKVTLEQPSRSLDGFKEKLSSVASGALAVFGTVAKAAATMTFAPAFKSLDMFQGKLGSISAGKSFSNIEREANGLNLGGMTRAVDGVARSFTMLEGVATVALGNIAAQASMRGAAMAKDLSFGQVSQGLEEYATNMNSIQTILANTQVSGAGLKEVNAALDELNHYSDQTIYNFSEMAKNIGTFTAAGVDLDTSTQSIKGIANLAALSGSNSQQAATAMYQLSQALSSGRVSLQDWNSVVNAGMGGTVFQRALAQTAQQMGTLSKESVELKGKMKNVTIEGQSFRESITAKPGEQSWLSKDVLTATLQQFTGDLTDAELAAQGFNEEQIKAIQLQAETAKKAATEVKTLKGVMDVVKESIASGWSQSFRAIFGDFEEAKKTFTELTTYITGWIGKGADARNEVLEGWNKMGGRTAVIEGIKNVFQGLFSVLKPIGQAFRDIFPAKTAQDLVEMSERFRDFTEQLKIGPELAEDLRRTFRGLFALMNIGKTIVGEIIGVIMDLLGVAGEGSGGFFEFTGSIGDFLVQVDKAISEGKGLAGIFDGLSAVMSTPLELLKTFASLMADLFGGIGSRDATNSLAGIASGASKLGEEFGPMGDVLEFVVKQFVAFGEVLEKVADFFGPVVDGIRDVGSAIINGLKAAFDQFDYDRALNTIQVGLLGGIALMVKKILSGDAFGNLGGGIVENLNGVLNELGGTLGTIQQNLKARTLMTIAIAVGVLAASAVAMSQVDADDLAKGMAAIAVGIGQMVAAVAMLSKVGGLAAGSAVLPLIAAGMVGMAAATVLLAGAVHLFARLSWNDLAKGLTGVAGALTAVGAASKLMGPGLILVGPALIPVAVALNMMAVAVKLFSTLDWDELAKGLIGVLGVLGAMAATLPMLGPAMRVIGPGLVGVGFGLILMSAAVRSFGSMNIWDLAKGLGALAASLAILAWATIGGTFKGLIVAAAGLTVLAVALNGIGMALRVMGGMKLGAMVKSLIMLGGSLLILAVGLQAMIGAGPGALALMGAAAAFAVLAPTLALLGSLSWGTILKGLVAMAATLGVIAVVGALAAPALLLMGAAMSALGLGILIVSTGIYVLAKGISLLSKEGQVGIAVLLTAITGAIALLPKIVIEFVKGLVEIIKQIGIMAPDIVGSLVKIVTSLLDALIELTPKLGEAIGTLLGQLLVIIEQHAIPIFQAGLRLFMEFLRGISENITPITQTVGQIITRFLNQMTIEVPRIIASGAKLLTAWLQGFRQHLGKVVTAAFDVANKFLTTVANQIPRFIQAGANVVVKFLNGVAQQLPRMIRAGTNVIVGFLNGIQASIPRVVVEAHQTIRAFLRAIGDREQVRKTVRTGLNAALNFVDGVTLGLRDSRFIEKLGKAAFDLGKEVAKQFLNGLRDLADEIQEEIIGFSLTRDYDEYDKEQERLHQQELDAIRKRGKSSAATSEREMKEVGRASGTGHVKGVVEKSPEVERAVRQSVRRSIRGARREAGIKSPSTEFRDIGRYMVEGMSEGLQGLPGALDYGISRPLQAMLAATKDQKKLGRFLGSQFAEGLIGSQDDIRNAFDALGAQLKESQAELRAKLQEDRGKLKELMRGGRENDKAVLEARKTLDQRRAELAQAKTRDDYDVALEEALAAERELNKLISQGRKNDAKVKSAFAVVGESKRFLEASSKATGQMMKDLSDEKQALLALADSYDVVMARLEEVNAFLQSTKDSYMQLPSFDVGLDAAMAEMADAELSWEQRREKQEERRKEAERKKRVDQVALYKKALEEQIKATEEYNKTLEALRAAGLDDTTYKKLLDQGVSGQDFASQLLKGGEESIKELNELNAKLEVAAENLSQDAADQLFAAGVHAAEGIVSGLQSQAAEIKAIMNAIAQDMVSTIKRQLKIKSPSQIFAKLGEFTGQGLVNGIRSTTSAVASAAGALGDDAARAMQDSLSRVADVVSSEVDSNLTITPVLDLSQVETEAKRMQGIFVDNVVPIEAAASYGQASAISSETQETMAAQAEAAASAAPTVIFEQNNMSPDKLSEIEIYRQTNNQLAQLKSVLPGLATG